ncbi:E3 ubiquitin ligase PARAQUAT TOLERANCE 3-like [Primulina tabacum]|uniref:E3 ubiquitin ligase PARAQUAT TOLERANCE 3-like n=1 Tax=Primulina tabacum TaxID=48773 RepID=UPI003F596802
MAVYYKFKSAKDYDSVAIDGNFISVGHLKEKIFELKHLGKGTDFDLVITNAQTNEEYLDEGTLIPKNTSVLVRRVPGRPRNPIITAPVAEQEEAKVENYSVDVQTVNSNFGGSAQSSMKYAEDLEWDEFGNDLYAIPETVPVQLNNTVLNPAPPVSKEDEDSKIKALIDTPALDWQCQPADGFAPGRGFGRGMGGRMIGGRGFGRGGLEKKIPPQGYICHRCKVPGHFIQHCATNGDPNYDIKRVKPPTGIPKSMLMATPDGSYALPSGAVAVLKPNEAAFEKQIEGMPSLRTVGDFPPELHCAICKEVMKDAVLTSKCCFKSFCDKCIRDHIISKSSCICGATNILADDLLPNQTLRDTINRILESNNSSAEDGGTAFRFQDMESRNPHARVPSPTQSQSQSAASRGEQVPTSLPQKEEFSKILDLVVEDKAADAPPATQMQEKGKSLKLPDVSEATHDSKSIKETTIPANAQLADEEVQQKLVSVEAAKKKKKKKIQMPPSAAEMQWRTAQDLAPDNYMMPLGPSTFNPYWNGIQPGFDGFVAPYAGPMSYMGYGFGPMDMAFGGGVFPQDPFGGGPGCVLPYAPPQRDLAELAMGFNAGPPPPAMSREAFEARKANLKRRREMERCRDMELSKDRENGREASSSVDLPKMRSKSESIPPASSTDHPSHRYRSERHFPDRDSRDPEVPRPSSKRKPEEHRSRDYNDDDHQRHHDHHYRSSRQRPSESPPVARRQPSMADKKHKASVFSRISFPAEDTTAPKKRKLSSSSETQTTVPSAHRQQAASSNGYHEEYHKTVSGSRKSSHAIAAYHEEQHDSSDEERHFKRRPSRYTSSSPPAHAVEAVEHHHSRGSRDRNHDRDQGGGTSIDSRHCG